MTPVLVPEVKSHSPFVDLLPAAAAALPGFDAMRAAALRQLERTGLPTRDHEEWRYTNLNPILRAQFTIARRISVPAERFAEVDLAGECAAQLVFINGYYDSELSTASLPHGVVVQVFSDPAFSNSAHLSDPVRDDQPLMILNQALITDGAVITVEDGVSLEKPIHLLFINVAESTAFVISPRVELTVGSNSSIRIIETSFGVAPGVYFSNSVTRLRAGENARVSYCKLERESEQSFHISNLSVEAARGSEVRSMAVSLGGAIVRSEIYARLAGEGSHVTLDGLYILEGTQRVDNHTVIDHAAPHTTSEELYKGVLGGHSNGIFDGKIIVRKEGQQTSSRQTNKNLLLSNDATADSKPQLEIHADDVKCAHGSTIGQLSEESIFYLRSRGIAYDEAVNMLTYAFASELIERIDSTKVREQITQVLLQRLPEQRKQEIS